MLMKDEMTTVLSTWCTKFLSALKKFTQCTMSRFVKHNALPCKIQNATGFITRSPCSRIVLYITLVLDLVITIPPACSSILRKNNSKQYIVKEIRLDCIQDCIILRHIQHYVTNNDTFFFKSGYTDKRLKNKICSLNYIYNILSLYHLSSLSSAVVSLTFRC